MIPSGNGGGRLGKLRVYFATHELMKGTIERGKKPAKHFTRTCKQCGKEFEVYIYRGRCGTKQVLFDTLECARMWYYHHQEVSP